jgi:ZIP family zinc transporter
MAELGEAAGWGAAVAASLVLGAMLAAFTGPHNRLSAELTAFGGGILFAAVALELVPEADAEAGAGLTAVGLVAGTLVYVAIDAWLNRSEETKKTRTTMHRAAAGEKVRMDMEVARGESIAAGLFVDGVPESIALGLTVAEGELGLALLAGVLVGNVVEAYGAAQPIVAGGRSARFAVGLLAGIGVALLLATVLGGTVLADAPGDVIGTAQALAAGAVLAVVSIAIVPHAFAEVKATVAVATILGFTAGYLLS